MSASSEDEQIVETDRKEESPKQETKTLRRSARIKNVKTPPNYKSGRLGEQAKQRGPVTRARRRTTNRLSATDTPEAGRGRRGTKRRSALVSRGASGRRRAPKRKRSSSDGDEQLQKAREDEFAEEASPEEPTVPGGAVKRKSTESLESPGKSSRTSEPSGSEGPVAEQEVEVDRRSSNASSVHELSPGDGVVSSSRVEEMQGGATAASWATSSNAADDAIESSVSMIVHAPSMIESSSLIDESDTGLTAEDTRSARQKTDGAFKQALSSIETIDRYQKTSDYVLSTAGRDTQPLDSPGLADVDISVLAGQVVSGGAGNHCTAKTEGKSGEEPLNSLQSQLKGLPNGAFVFSAPSATLHRRDVKLVLSCDCKSNGLMTAQDVVCAIDTCSPDLIFIQNPPQGLNDSIPEAFKQLGSASQQLVGYSQNPEDSTETKTITIDNICDEMAEVIVDPSGFAIQRLKAVSAFECQLVETGATKGNRSPLPVANLFLTRANPDIACVELAGVLYYLKSRYARFAICGNWSAFSGTREAEEASLLQVLLGKPEQVTLYASFRNPVMVETEYQQNQMLIPFFAGLFENIEHQWMSNFDDQNRPASDIWTAGGARVVAAWQRAGASPMEGMSLAAVWIEEPAPISTG